MTRDTKTNVMRLLTKAGIPYETAEYAYSEDDLSGTHAADVLGLPYERVYKTLMLKGDRTGYFVCVIPVDREVDLKAAARISGNKRAEMIPMKDLLPVTGYIRGGCSPVGMKKQFPAYIDAQAAEQERISVSAGQRGVQVILNPEALAEYIGAEFIDITK